MRVTNNTRTFSFQKNLNDINTRKFTAEQRLTTGKKILSLGDNPRDFIDAQNITEIIERNKQYSTYLNEGLDDLRAQEDSLTGIADWIMKVSDTVKGGISPANSDQVYLFGDQVKKLLTDLVDKANGEFSGKYILGGTKTTQESITPVPPQINKMPFEIVNVAPTIANPSGIEVHFKGNNSERTITKGAFSQEKVNTTSDQFFGGSGTALLDTIRDLHNTLSFKSDGTARANGETLKPADLQLIHGNLKKLTDGYDTMNRQIGLVGDKLGRYQALSDQMLSENTRLSEMRSNREDANVAEEAINLRKQETSLQYTLQIGSKMMNLSLFDFLR